MRARAVLGVAVALTLTGCAGAAPDPGVIANPCAGIDSSEMYAWGAAFRTSATNRWGVTNVRAPFRHRPPGVSAGHPAAPRTKSSSKLTLRNTRLTVQVSTKLNRSHLVCGDTALILPTKGRTEKDVQASGEQWISVEDSTCSVHASRGPLQPASPFLKSEVEIVTGIAEATLGDRHEIAWQAMRNDYSVIRQHISCVVPGCSSYEVDVRRPGGFVMPHPPRDSRTFPTSSGKAEFKVSPIDTITAPEGHLLLQTLRSHDQYNTTIYGLSDRYRGVEGGRGDLQTVTAGRRTPRTGWRSA